MKDNIWISINFLLIIKRSNKILLNFCFTINCLKFKNDHIKWTQTNRYKRIGGTVEITIIRCFSKYYRSWFKIYIKLIINRNTDIVITILIYWSYWSFYWTQTSMTFKSNSSSHELVHSHFRYILRHNGSYIVRIFHSMCGISCFVYFIQYMSPLLII